MPDQPQNSGSASPQTAHKPKKEELDVAHVPMTEEFDSAKHSLPNFAPVAIAMGIVAVVLIAVVFLFRATPSAQGSVTDAFAVDIPNQNQVLATVGLTFKNVEKKPIFIRTIRVKVKTADGELTDEMASSADFERYFQAFPPLKEHAGKPLPRELRLQPNESVSGTVIVAFPTTAEKFNQRQSLSADLDLYDQKPVTLTETKK